MPEQNPTCRIISMSYAVRIRSRCASRSLLCFSNSASRSASSSSMPRNARAMRSGPAV